MRKANVGGCSSQRYATVASGGDRHVRSDEVVRSFETRVDLAGLCDVRLPYDDPVSQGNRTVYVANARDEKSFIKKHVEGANERSARKTLQPRSLLAGVVMLGKTVHKARAAIEGTLGAYNVGAGVRWTDSF